MKEKKLEQNNEVKEEPVQYEEVKVEYQQVEKSNKKIRTDSYFDGGLLELIGWRILAFLIIGLTFGIATPWAKCMIYNYQFKHTVFNGKRLKFEGTGGDLFVNYFKWIFFTIITLGIYLFFVPVRKTKWVISNLHFEDEEFVTGESFFDGKTIQLVGINILCKLLNFISFGLLIPFTTCFKLRWISKHTVINKKRIVFDGKAISLLGHKLLWLLLTVVTFGIFGLWLPIMMFKWQAKNIHIKVVGEEEKKDKSLYFVIPVLIIGVILFSLIVPKIVTTISNTDINEGFNIEEIFENISGSFEGNRGNTKTPSEKVMYPNPDSSTSVPSKNDTPTTSTENTNKQPTNNNQSQSQQQPTVEPEKKTSITVGGYTLKFGTYKGQIEQGVWDEETMTPTLKIIDVTLKLTENSISFDGQSGSYSFNGNRIVWNGSDYMFEVAGNNKIRFNAETCPILTYQGY